MTLTIKYNIHNSKLSNFVPKSSYNFFLSFKIQKPSVIFKPNQNVFLQMDFYEHFWVAIFSCGGNHRLGMQWDTEKSRQGTQQ